MPDAVPTHLSPVLPRRSVLGLGTLGLAALAGCTASSAPTPAASGPTVGDGASGRQELTDAVDAATGLQTPWSVVVLPDHSVLVSERDPGTVRRLDGRGGTSLIGTVPGVAAGGEGGLLGLAVDRRTYATTPVLYAYLTAPSDNRVVAVTMEGGRLGAQRTVLAGIPKGSIHNGGRIAFGPDGYLYVTTGENGNRAPSQDRQSLGGKVLRITTEGSPAPGNPFAGSPVWSYGHRNPQGIAWDASGRMWASEFGQDTWDELNVIRPGANYGWPTVEGQQGREGFVDPVRQWATKDASPSGIAIGPDGAVLMAALRGESLWKIPVGADGSTQEPQRLLQGEYGRLRDVLVGPDGNVWVVTNNTSRGTPRAGDDRIVRLPQSLTG
ncbi:MAG: PQQ-dependent sugar dehydrogenase [Lapillicoccus sp.]